MVQSTQPVATKDSSGHEVAIDTKLEPQGDGFKAANPLAPVTIAGQADGENALARADVRFHLPDAAGSGASLSDDKAFYPNSMTDSDLTVAPATGGLEVLVQLRSADSPERIPIDFDLPAGANMRLIDGESVLGSPLPPADEKGVAITEDGQVAATIAPPSAIDADGQKVPAHYELDGNQLIVVVPHRSGDFHYPILVDPYVVDRFAWREDNGNDLLAQNYGWAFRQYSSGYSFYDCSQLPSCYANSGLNGIGLYVQGHAGSWSSAGWWGEWYFQAPHGASIVRTDWRQMGMTTLGNSCMYAYISGPTSNNSGNRYSNCNNTGTASQYPVSCTDIWNPCSTNGSASGNQAVFGLQIWNGTYVDIWSMLGGAYVNMWEGWPPVVSNVRNVPTGWVDNATFSGVGADVHDDGLGIANQGLYLDGVNQVTYGAGCTGTYQSPCLNDKPYSGIYSYSTNAMTEGIHRGEYPGSRHHRQYQLRQLKATAGTSKSTTRRQTSQGHTSLAL